MAQGAPPDRPRAGLFVLAGLVSALAIGAGAYWLARASAPPSTPASNSAEAGFARDMQVHHIQGAELALIVRDRTDDMEVRGLAYDIASTQEHQAGQLYGWLAAWGLKQLGSDPPMTWMGHTGHGMNALMPGMATPEQIKELSAASGIEAERLFLSLMITHHRGALEMSTAVLERSSNPIVVAFARAVLTSQQSEIDLMTSMLQAREKP